MEMVRTIKSNKVDAILVADLHLTETPPASRIDDYLEAQANKLHFLKALQNQYNCPILCAGDIFDKWRVSTWFCSWVYQNLPAGILTIQGNHDLPMHSLDQYPKSALSLLEMVGHVIILSEMSYIVNGLEIVGVPFGKLEGFTPNKKTSGIKRKILLLHELVWPKNRPDWASNSYVAQELLDRFEGDFDLIVTGDNHESFTAKTKKSLLVNPGGMMRSSADQIENKPKCYLYHADLNEVSPVEFPIQQGVHSREHIDPKKERDERIAAYIERMSTDWRVGLSFRKNLELFFSENNTNEKIRRIIWTHLEKTS